MQRIVWRTWLAALVGALALGCEHESANRYPPDPLLIGKKPVEGKVDPAAPLLLARSEPVAPTLPPMALAKSSSMPAEHAEPQSEIAQIPERLVRPPTIPAVQSPVAPTIVATPAVRRRIPGAYGHAADYSWLKGVLDKQDPNNVRLCYSETPDEEASGGIVRLEDDPRLAAFQDGDVIVVEGELVRENGLPVRDADNRPHYRVRSVRPEQGP